jgi:hypothetical protein
MRINIPQGYKVMAEKDDIFALEKPNGLPAYPKMVYRETGEKHKNGAPVMEELGIVKNPDEHKKLLKDNPSGQKEQAWAGAKG